MLLALIIVLLVVVLVALVWVNRGIFTVTQNQAAHMTVIESIQAEFKLAQERSRKQSAYGWYDEGWPVAKCDEEDRAPLENPTLQRSPDDYATQMYILEYKSMRDAHQRKEFLRQLRDEAVWMKPELLDVIYGDESDFVRAWAASHLYTEYTDYTDSENPREVRNYEPILLRDSEPLVRAALWSNPKCKRLPWGLVHLSEGWKEHIRGISQLERLGLMRNPELGMQYVVALLETPSNELGIARKEHAEVLCAAAVNPNLIRDSRFCGRKGWIGGGEGNPPFKEFGTMWTLCLEKWMDEYLVPFLFFTYVQTTPEIKLAVYTRLLEKAENQEYKWLRVEVIRSCDPFDDGPVLKKAWNDPDEKCRETARERVGSFTKWVGVQETAAR